MTQGRMRTLIERILLIDPDSACLRQQVVDLQALARQAKNVRIRNIGKGPGTVEGRLKARLSLRQKALTLHLRVRPIIDKIMADNPGMSWGEVARELDRLGLIAPRGDRWARSTVQAIAMRPENWIDSSVELLTRLGKSATLANAPAIPA
jgi:hypothetical protein